MNLAHRFNDSRVLDSPALFTTSFPPAAALVGAVRRFVFSFYARMLGDPDSSSRVALATHELLENAVCYCARGEVTIRVTVAPSREGRIIRVRTHNAASAEDIAALQEVVAQLEAASDPVVYYQQRMQQTLRQARDSGLGLPRICAEAGMEIGCSVSGDTVEITAQTLLEAKVKP